MRVDIWGDIVCPWCYIGERRFARGLAGFEHHDEVDVVYRSFELDPSIPKGQATPVLDMLATKYGLSRAEAASRVPSPRRLSHGHCSRHGPAEPSPPLPHGA